MPYASFINGRANERLRGLQFLALSDTGHVSTRTYTSDTGGGASQVWADGPPVFCRVESIAERAQSSLEGGRVDERSNHIVTTPAGTDVQADDRFVIDGRGTFEVTALRHASAEWVCEFEVIQIT